MGVLRIVVPLFDKFDEGGPERPSEADRRDQQGGDGGKVTGTNGGSGDVHGFLSMVRRRAASGVVRPAPIPAADHFPTESFERTDNTSPGERESREVR